MRAVRASVFGIVLLLICAGLVALPQEPESSRPLRIDVRLVNVYTTVMDSNGRYVHGLKQNDFLVEEDGKRQKVTSIDQDQEAPASIGILLDTSGSMRSKLDTALDAVERFLKTIHPDDDVFLMGFDSESYLMQDFTSDRTKLKKSLRYADLGGGTSLYDALEDAMNKIRSGANKKRAILLITDGQDRDSLSTFDAARRHLRSSEVLLYALGISASRDVEERGRAFGGSDSVDMDVLKALAGDSGGHAFSVSEDTMVGRNSRFDEILQQIAEELRNQYTLAYYPTHPDDGAYHTIHVATRYGYSVRARRGYIAAVEQ
jgi:Ca-activated chloride channel family protein